MVLCLGNFGSSRKLYYYLLNRLHSLQCARRNLFFFHCHARPHARARGERGQRGNSDWSCGRGRHVGSQGKRDAQWVCIMSGSCSGPGGWVLSLEEVPFNAGAGVPPSGFKWHTARRFRYSSYLHCGKLPHQRLSVASNGISEGHDSQRQGCSKKFEMSLALANGLVYIRRYDRYASFISSKSAAMTLPIYLATASITFLVVKALPMSIQQSFFGPPYHHFNALIIGLAFVPLQLD